jgi:hypothetical protein
MENYIGISNNKFKEEIFIKKSNFCIKNGFNYTEKDHVNIFKDNFSLESMLLDNMKHEMCLGKLHHGS